EDDRGEFNRAIALRPAVGSQKNCRSGEYNRDDREADVRVNRSDHHLTVGASIAPERPRRSNSAAWSALAGREAPGRTPPVSRTGTRSVEKSLSVAEHRGFAKIEHAELRQRHIPGATGLVERVDRCIDAFGRQLKCTEMHADALRGTQIEVRLHRFRRVH